MAMGRRSGSHIARDRATDLVRSWLPRGRLTRIEGRVVEEPPAKRALSGYLHDLVDLDLDRPLRARELGEVLAIPENTRPPGELERCPRVEVHEEEPDPRVRRDIAERLEHIVPGIVGKAQPPIVHAAHEARLAAAMGRIGCGFTVSPRDEECVGALNGEPVGRGECHAPQPGTSPLVPGLVLRRSSLNVFWTVAEDFLDSDIDGTRALADRAAIEPDPASPLRIKHEDAERRVSGKTTAEGIGVRQGGGQAQLWVVRRSDEAESSRHRRRPNASLVIQTRQDRDALSHKERFDAGWNRSRDAQSQAPGLGGNARPPLHRPLPVVEDSHVPLDETRSRADSCVVYGRADGKPPVNTSRQGGVLCAEAATTRSVKGEAMGRTHLEMVANFLVVLYLITHGVSVPSEGQSHLVSGFYLSIRAWVGGTIDRFGSLLALTGWLAPT